MKKLLFLSILLGLLTTVGFSQTVYITKTGKKYHIESCRYLRSSSIPISLSEALNRYYDACSVCAPPTKPSIPSQNPSRPSSPKTEPKESPQRKENRCSAITKAGNQCSRTSRSNGLCWQHGG